MKGLDTNIYDVVCVSPRNHMVFTHLLASTCVGTLEFRSVAEPIAQIQPLISRETGSYFFLANSMDFEISYDKLIIASSSVPLTFGIHGVEEHAFFLREVHHAQEIKRKLLLNLMLSDVLEFGSREVEAPTLCCCGGGPIGVEFSGELSDFIMRNVHQRFAHVKNYIHVTLIEANEILSSFDDRLQHYATRQLTKSGVRLVRGIVKDVKVDKIILNNGTEVPYGLLVWSTRVGPSSFVKSIEVPKSPGGRIGIDEWLCVPSAQEIFAIGDCSGFLESTGKPVLPALAQVAERQGKYIAKQLNRIGKAGGGYANKARDKEFREPLFISIWEAWHSLADTRLLWTLVS
ncbi:Internal alternative NAD(P)H-ubiquinone oxidoreductase A1, mitochondrial [Vitis vinifera]|uniref:Internal alternative NAD(P)H-ubiquinone oxidoreductase A1, mitochondrial n=1 Tax=Vitis vinifera TaxID=29760 RepID=A0A438DMM6_VITVI|nr:Internal alternative NAD(P)H-ubiquinone oxidoreductase A1, mitochondrial [Vitis vinifera]